MKILIIGAGLFGATCARELTKNGETCQVIDKKDHIGGNCYAYNKEGINIHKYGPHIFHTNNRYIWNYINTLSEFNNFIYRPKVIYKDNLYSFPINLLTLNQLYGIKTPQEAKDLINRVRVPIKNPQNLEEWCLSTIGKDLYKIFFKNYSTKQWGKHPVNLPASLGTRIPFRTNFNDNYFNDKYQGIPTDGYAALFKNMLAGIPVHLNTNFNDDQEYFKNKYNLIIFTGSIDDYYQHVYGGLPYRSLYFETQRLNTEDFQGNSVINFTDNAAFTRIIEHKHFDITQKKKSYTIITREYPKSFILGQNDAYYPINTEDNVRLFNKYKKLSTKDTTVYFGGRLGEYKYYNMDQTIESALSLVKNIGKK